MQCFVGGTSSYNNLLSIPEAERRQIPVFDEAMKKELFDGLEEVMGENWVLVVWDFLKERANRYEDLCDPRS